MAQFGFVIIVRVGIEEMKDSASKRVHVTTVAKIKGIMNCGFEVDG